MIVFFGGDLALLLFQKQPFLLQQSKCILRGHTLTLCILRHVLSVINHFLESLQLLIAVFIKCEFRLWPFLWSLTR